MLALTSEDKLLSLPLNGRDPLGILPVWQYRARDIVLHLTAASTQAEGFQLLLTTLAWWPEFARQYGRPQTDLPRFFLLVEQAFARACKCAGVPWQLPGTQRLYSGGPGLWMSLAPAHHLLGSQLANGTWGIYRGPALNAGFIDGMNRITDPTLELQLRKSSGVIAGLFPAIQVCLKEPDQQGPVIGKRRDHALVRGLTDLLLDLPVKTQLKARVLLPEQAPLTAALARMSRRMDPVDDYRRFLEAAAGELPQHSDVLQGVIKCEGFLATLEAIFEFLCAQVDDLNTCAARLKVDLRRLRGAQRDFGASGTYQGLARERADALQALNMESLPKLLRSLLEHHEGISRSRRSDPWITIGDSGRVSCRLAVDEPAAAQLDPRKAWRNSYYLGALSSLSRRLNIRES